MNQISVLFACDTLDSTSAMGGTKANAQLVQALNQHPLVSRVVTTKRDLPMTGCDVLVVEAPTGLPFIEACAPKYTFVLRHGDTPIGDCAYEQFERGSIEMLVPSHEAARTLPRVPYTVQYMALEPPPAPIVLPSGTKVLHARAFDFMKDTGLAIEVAKAAPDLEFVFRMTPGSDALSADLPPNVTVAPAVSGPELWQDIGCVLLTSRAETFSMIAYEAIGRGVAVVAHGTLMALAEWGGAAVLFDYVAPQLAAKCELVLRRRESTRQGLVAVAKGVHERAEQQLNRWVTRMHREVYP